MRTAASASATGASARGAVAKIGKLTVEEIEVGRLTVREDSRGVP